MIFYMIDRVINFLFIRLCIWYIYCIKLRLDFVFGGFVLFVIRVISFRIYVGEVGCVIVLLFGKDKMWFKEVEGCSV